MAHLPKRAGSDVNPVQVAEGTQVIHVSFRSAEVDPVYFPQLEVIGDIANAIWQIKNGLSDHKDAGWDFSRMMAVKQHHDANMQEWRRRPSVSDLPTAAGRRDPRCDAG